MTTPLSSLPEYQIWMAMRRRCSDPKRNSWARYGGRGIRVCAEWDRPGGFEPFLNHIGARPDRGYSLDRYPNNDGNYEPGNVRWATRAEQAKNRNRNGNQRGYAKMALRQSGRIHGVNRTIRLISEIRSALEEEFGPPRNELNPAHFIVEQAYWDRDFGRASYHFEGTEYAYRVFVTERPCPTQKDWLFGPHHPSGREAAE